MTPFQIIAILITLTAIGAYLNEKFIKFPATIGSMAFAFLLSLVTIIFSKLGLVDLQSTSFLIRQIDFSAILLHGILSFLLFAGSLQISLNDLRSVKWPVAILSTIGVVIATFVTGTLISIAAAWLGLDLPYIYSLLFGALISPTDPIAVLSILKEAGISQKIYVQIGAESLFNDGIGVVLFMTILALADGSESPSLIGVTRLLLREALGGGLLGVFLAWITYRLVRSIDAYKVEVLLTFALVSGGYVLAESLNFSAPICMVTAGLVFGNRGRNRGMSIETRNHMDDFWEILDEILNGILFMLIGFEMIVITITGQHLLLGLLAILIVLLGRIISVALVVMLIELKRSIDWRFVGLLTWGGLRGGLSVAMALSLADSTERSILLPITYIVVLFSVLVQGLTFEPFLKFLVKKV